MQRIPLMIIPYQKGRRLYRRLLGIGKKLSRIFKIDKDLKESDIGLQAREYLALSLLNAFVLFLIFSLLFSWVFFVRLGLLTQALSLGFLTGLGLAFLFFIVYVRYPKILAGKNGERIDKNLVFVLKDMLLQVSSGVSLYNSMINIANSNYGEVSQEFEETVTLKTGTGLIGIPKNAQKTL